MHGYSSSSESNFFNSSTEKNSTKRRTKCSKDAINHRESSVNSKVNQRTLPFNSSLRRLTNNLNAIRSTPTKKSIDFDSNTKPLLDTNEHSSNLTVIEKLYINNLINIESTHNNRKSIVKSSYQIPSPTILLPGEFPSSSKPISSSNMIQRSTPIDNNRNLLTFNQPNSFHLKTHSTDNTEELISTTSINSLNLIHTLHHEGFTIHKTSQNSILSTQQNFSQITNDLSINPTSTLPQDLQSPPFKLLRDKIDNENIQFELPTDTSPQIKIHHEIKPEFESLWKTKLTLKTLLSMANRDEAQALKNRKPIDYHMFLSNKFNKNSILQYDDYIDTKFTANNKHIVIEQDYNENRELYKRLLDTMGLRKPLNTKKTESMKRTKTKRRTKIIQENIFPSSDDSINETEKPVLITYQAIPI